MALNLSNQCTNIRAIVISLGISLRCLSSQIQIIINTIVTKELPLHKRVVEKVKILDYNNNLGQLQYLEEYHIKKLNPEINVSLKASK